MIQPDLLSSGKNGSTAKIIIPVNDENECLLLVGYGKTNTEAIDNMRAKILCAAGVLAQLADNC